MLVVKRNIEPLEVRSGDLVNKYFEVGTDALEVKRAKVRECGVYDGWRTRRLHLHIMVDWEPVRHGDIERL